MRAKLVDPNRAPAATAPAIRIGVISDTHGLLRPEAVAALAGCDHILHAGDVGDDNILAALRKIAPLTAIRGNVDHNGVCATLPPTEAVELSGKLFYMVHARADLDLDPQAASVSAIVFGHSHQPEITWQNGILYFNPGSAGPRRFRLPITIGFIDCIRGELHPRIETILE
ncbi:MAG: metallophosphoesterase family protein [Acidobacteriaceae bacterium]